MDACSLTGDDLAVRLVELREMLRRAVGRDHLGDSISFRFRREDEGRLRELTAREQECCTFWHFSIEPDGAEVVMDVGVTSPRFAPFVDRFYALAT